MRKNVAVAMKRTAMAGAGIMRKGIAHRQFGLAPNAPATIAAKGSSLPLVDHGDLVGAIAGQTKSWNIAFIGIAKNKRGRDGKSLVNIAQILVEGATIRIPEIYPAKGKALKFPVHFASSLGVVGGKAPRTSLTKRGKVSGMDVVFARRVRGHTIKIPKRDFITPTLKKLQPIHQQNLTIAIRQTFVIR